MSLRRALWAALLVAAAPADLRAEEAGATESAGEAESAEEAEPGGEGESAEEDSADEEQGADRFFHDDSESAADKDETTIDGSLTTTLFAYREVGAVGVAPIPGGAPPNSASPVDRVFGDARLQLDAEHIGGRSWDFRFDGRARYAPELCRARSINGVNVEECPAAQSGTFGGNELDLRELYLQRRGEKTDLRLGRQWILELAATRLDGLSLRRRADAHWTYLAFAGAHPWRISRDIGDDYPEIPVDAGDPTGPQKRKYPWTAGAGASYRYQKAYGSLGVVGIVPLATDESTGTLEQNRVFAAASGYWRRSQEMDFFHYLVLDGSGAACEGRSTCANLTNLTLGVNYRPKTTVRAHAQVNRVDSDTLNLFAQSRLEDPGIDPAQPQNNIDVLRIAQESARAGITAAFAQSRFELGVVGMARRRPEINLRLGNDEFFIIPRAQAADLTLRALDRRSFRDLRLGLSVTRSIGLGEVNLDRSQAWLARIDGSREMWRGKGELEASLSYVQSQDEYEDPTCDPLGNPLGCFGTSRQTMVSGGAAAYYRPRDKWFVLGLLNVGRQSIETASVTDDIAEPVSQPSIFLVTLMGRVAYRF